jgi:hypothetical protein
LGSVDFIRVPFPAARIMAAISPIDGPDFQRPIDPSIVSAPACDGGENAISPVTRSRYWVKAAEP